MDHHHGVRTQRRAAYARATGLVMAAFMAVALLSPTCGQQAPDTAHGVHCDLPIEKWEAQLPPAVAPPVAVEGTKFSRILPLWEGAATLFYDSVDAPQGRRKVALYMQGFERIITFDASHVYEDRPDYEPADGWMVYSLLFIDATQSLVHKVAFLFRRKHDGTAGVEEFRINPVESFSGRCYK